MPKKRIAIIEDDQTLLKVTTSALTQAGYDVVSAVDGQAGLALVLREHPDLVLMDILLPVLSGTEVLKALRQNAWGKDVKVIMFTNVSDSEYVSQAMELGAYIYLVKSAWKISEVVEKVKEQIG